jgi:hypothetical protein
MVTFDEAKQNAQKFGPEAIAQAVLATVPESYGSSRTYMAKKKTFWDSTMQEIIDSLVAESYSHFPNEQQETLKVIFQQQIEGARSVLRKL